MRKRQIELLQNLISIPSPSGFEKPIANFILSKFKNQLPKDSYEIDKQNNLRITIKGKRKESIVLESHTDTIGFTLTNVDSKGFISAQYIGGGDTQILSARHLNILTSKGIVNAVINRKPTHLVIDEDDEKIDYIHEAQIDIGIRGRRQVLRKVKIGDPIVYQPMFRLLAMDKHQGQAIGGYGFDDKSGCFILMEVIREILKQKKIPYYTLHFVFSSKEEIGHPPKKLTCSLKPSFYICVDVTFATDYGEYTLEKEVGKCELGKGIVLYRGSNIDNETVKEFSKIAKLNKIKVQYQASTGRTGYNGEEMTSICDRIIIMAPPLRSMHTAVETINTKDLQYGINLLTKFLLGRKK